MKILIADVNKPIIEKYVKVRFIQSTTNTSYFNFPRQKFIKLLDYIRSEGYNPYALLYW